MLCVCVCVKHDPPAYNRFTVNPVPEETTATLLYQSWMLPLADRKQQHLSAGSLIPVALTQVSSFTILSGHCPKQMRALPEADVATSQPSHTRLRGCQECVCVSSAFLPEQLR